MNTTNYPPTHIHQPQARTKEARIDMWHAALIGVAGLALGFITGHQDPEPVAPIVEVVEIETSSTVIERQTANTPFTAEAPEVPDAAKQVGGSIAKPFGVSR